ncbi:hypothetical protein QBC43DRAFT_47064 [Cladorrhinum sp. PSN259]|nr:hypothetical protein QBC43DRAFT_47064 [Cladorrhinum sp. PSN259]
MESSYRVAPAGSAVLLAAFVALIPINIFNGIRYKTPAYALVLTVALILEAISHIGRIFMSTDSATKSHAILYLIGTHWGPILIGSAIYMILPHVTVIYGQQFRLVSKGIYLNIAFVLLDLFALVFQFVGIVVVVNASTSSETKQALTILLAGLSIHAATLLIFLSLYRYFHFRLSHREYILDARLSHVYLSRRFKYYLIGAQIASILLLPRAIIRITATSGTLSIHFSVPEIATFLVDDCFTLLALLILSILPVGRAFSSSWAETSPVQSPDALSDLPLRRHLHRHRDSAKNHQIHKRHISYPCPSNTTGTAVSPPFTPGWGVNTAPTELPAHSWESPLTSPRHNPVYQRGIAPYEVPYDQEARMMVVPFIGQASPKGREAGGRKNMAGRDHLWELA